MIKKDLVAEDRPNVKAAISIHSYGQLWMSPYGYKSDTPTDYEEMVATITIKEKIMMI